MPPTKRVRTSVQREKQRVSQRRYDKRRAKKPHRMLLNRLRVHMNDKLRAGSTRHSVLLGCTGLQLKAHIESLWAVGMNWQNRRQWHIDHRRPCSAFDLDDPEQLRQCGHYTNLQPLWARDNLRKSASYDPSTFEFTWIPGRGWVR